MFLRAMVRIFSFGERWNVPFNSAVASLNGTFHLSPHENILTIALINIHYLYNITIYNHVYYYTTRRHLNIEPDREKPLAESVAQPVVHWMDPLDRHMSMSIGSNDIYGPVDIDFVNWTNGQAYHRDYY